ncbi:hypothetical protein QEN19_001324 [Hanseniaspora menglaensis]
MLRNSIKQKSTYSLIAKRLVSNNVQPIKTVVKGEQAKKSGRSYVTALFAVLTISSIAVGIPYRASKDLEFDSWIMENVPSAIGYMNFVDKYVLGNEKKRVVASKPIVTPPITSAPVKVEPVVATPAPRETKIVEKPSSSLSNLDLHPLTIKTSSLTPEMAKLVSFYNTLLDKLSTHNIKVEQHIHDELQLSINSAKDNLEALVKEEPYKKDLTAKFEQLEHDFENKLEISKEQSLKELTEGFEKFKNNLEENNKKELDTAIKNFDQLSHDEKESQLISAMVTQLKQFDSLIQKTVDAAYNSKLNRLNELETFTFEMGSDLEYLNFITKTNFAKQQFLESVSLFKNQFLEETIKFEEISSYLKKWQQLASIVPSSISKCGCKKCDSQAFCNCPCSTKNSISKVAVTSLLQQQENNEPVLTKEQLLQELQVIKPKIIEASLVPNKDAGLLNYLVAKIFSPMILTKNESKLGFPVSDSVEDKLARVDYNLNNGKLDKAVEELNSFEGWPRVVESDYLEKVRRHLELQTLVDVIEADLRS